MSFITLKDYKNSFSEEKTKRQEAFDKISGEDPKELDNYQPPEDNRKSVGGIIGAFFIAFAINFVLSLILVAIFDRAYPNPDPATEERIKGIYFASMFILPIITVIICVVRNAKIKGKLKKYKQFQQTQEYQEAARIQQEYDEQKQACEKELEAIKEKMNPNNFMGVIYVDGGAPATGTLMGSLCVDSEENEIDIIYRVAPYEFYIPSGTHTVMIKSGKKVIWKERFSFTSQKVYTIDIAGAADTAQLSSDLDKFSHSGRSDIRYQEVTKQQYKNACKYLERKPTAYVMQ